MKTPRWFNRNRILLNARIIAALVLILAAAALAFVAISPRAIAQPTAAPTGPTANQQLSPEEARLREEWRISMAQIPLPKKGCFESAYPSREWREVPCTTGPDYPMPPRRGPRPLVVGNGDDVAAEAPSGFISTAIGSFDSVSGVTSESGPIGNTGPAVANAYTLQLNTNFFTSTVCSGSPNPGCQGWQQFVFENNNVSHRAFIQYWLIKYNNPCPSGWTQVPSGSDTYCVILANSSGAVTTSPVPVTNLNQVTLTGTASAGSDSITMTIGASAFQRVGDNAVKASAGWKIAEFNVVGDG